VKIISAGYIKTTEFDNPRDWLERISFYTGVLEELARQHEVLSIERINFKGVHKQKGVTYHFIRLKRKVILFPWRMHRFIRKQCPDVVLVHGFIFPLQIIQLRWALGKDVKIIVQNHGEKPFSGIRKFLQRMADRYISSYLFTSAEMGVEWVEKGIIGRKEKIAEVMEVSATFSASDKRNDYTINPGSPVFLWVGRLNANKDPETVVRAFVNFLSVQPLAELNMIYQEGGLLEQVREIINSNDKAGEAIKLIGQIPNSQLEEWYCKADFFISGSHYESGGVAVCEAMSCGCIPLLTDISSFRKVTGPGKCGLLYEAGNDKALLNILLQTQKMDLLEEKTRVLQQFREELSCEAIAGKIDQVLYSL